MENIKLAYSEVYAIINLMSYNLRSKIPSNFIKLILSEKDDKYIPRIERDIPLEEQNLKKETISILAFLKLNCFCNEEEKKAFMTMLSENELNFQKYLNEKYNVENLFKNKVNKLQSHERGTTIGSAMIGYQKKNFIQKIWGKIKKIFKIS